MLSAIAIIPSAPVLVPLLAGGAAIEVADLRTAVAAAAASLPPRWIAVGRGDEDAVFGPDSVGTLAGFGVDVPVRLSRQASEPVDLPLCALIAGWVREQAQPDARTEVRVYAEGRDVDTALALGRHLRVEIEWAVDPIGVLVVADGANTLTAAAPGGYDPRDVDVQLSLDNALAGGDTTVLTRLPAQIVGRVVFALLAGLVEPGPRLAKELHRGAPYGVGYFAGVWQP